MEKRDFIDIISSKILSYSGIYVANSQIPAVSAFVEKKAAQSGTTPLEYCEKLSSGSADFDELINLVTVNETYFFREEKQFDLLKNEIFPKFADKNLTIWTCCCSTGEEPISILALALSMNINITLYASDIDDDALNTLHKGRYSAFSLRTDGKKYHKLLEPYSKKEEHQIVFSQDFLSRINVFKFNLIKDTSLPFFDNVDIIFMRNVFIYFDKETRILVCKKIADRLKNNGYLFFSMNEIGSIDRNVIPAGLYKTNREQVYYFVKGHIEEAKCETPAVRYSAQKQESIKQEKLRHEVEKVRSNRLNEQSERVGNGASGAAGQQSALSSHDASSNAECSDFDIKGTFESICSEINRNSFEKAMTIARAVSGSNYKKYSFFLQGYIEYHADKRDAAETFFASAETLSPDFWPAFFYHGIVLRDMGRTEQATVCFTKCKKLLESCKSKVQYDFTLDSFSPSYIYSLCETFTNAGGSK
ncbi:MAG: hypothetical protein J5747_00205 [Spirochaetaceae bacterium]|nr:hypothetical protein [Spirochaetaceae bacterium]